jgi:hypothetical protein
VNYLCDNYEHCHNWGKNVFKCETCGNQWCNDCWGAAPKHKALPPDAEYATAHEKTNLILETAIRNVFDPETSSVEWRQRKEVAQSFWFGIQKREGDYFFEEGTIYEQLLQMSESPSAATSGVYPGLVSFVGETGEGPEALPKYSFVVF